MFTVLLPLLDPRMTGELKTAKGSPTDPGRARAKHTPVPVGKDQQPS